MPTELDRLPPDQRAVLSLVLERGKSYSEVADMLAIPESAVRERAHAALDALAVVDSSARPPRTNDAPSAAAPAPRTARARAARPDSSSADAPRAAAPLASKRGGALLLAAIVVVIVVVIVIVTSGGGGKSSTKTNASTTTPTTSTASSTTGKGKTTLDKTITMTAAEPGIKASGKTFILSQGGQRAFYIAAQNLPPSSGFFYAVWLYNSPSSAKPLGRAPTVGSNGRMEGGGPLPTDASSYHQLIVTRETSTHPSEPGQMVMTGPFSVH
jgi:hypothetical protein